MKIFNSLKNLLAILCVMFMVFSTIATADIRPIITLSVGSPFSPKELSTYPAYIIKIFESGRVEYNGLHLMKVHGKREYQMDEATLKVLIKKIQEENLLTEDRWLNLLGEVSSPARYYPIIGIRFRQGDQEVTTIGRKALELKRDIIRATKAERWGADKVKFDSSLK